MRRRDPVVLRALRIAAREAKAQGLEVELVEFNDWNTPNAALANGDIDVNYFQHIPYLENFNEEQGTHLVNAGGIHYEPFGIYGNGVTDLKDLAKGATIIIPADDSNETRALLLLAQEGLIELPADLAARLAEVLPELPEWTV